MAPHSPQQTSHWHFFWALGVACAAVGVGRSDAVFLGGCRTSKVAAMTFAVAAAATSLTAHEHSEPLPRFVESMKNTTSVQGRDATFICIVDYIGPYVVAWMKEDSKAVLAMHKNVVISSNRLSPSHNGHNTWTLKVTNVHKSDEGWYMCQINTEPMTHQSAYLRVLVSPNIHDDKRESQLMDGSSDNLLPEGSAVRRQCLATGDPEPSISWKREDGHNIVIRNEGGRDKMPVKTVESSILHLNNVQRQDMGIYLCIASNGVSPTVSKRYPIYVKFQPIIKDPNQVLFAPVRSNLVIQCTVESWPKAMNTWWRETGKRRDRIEITPSLKYSLDEEVISEYSRRMNLTIRDLTTYDFGGYICSSQNTLGAAEGLVRVLELDVTLPTSTVPPSTTPVTSPTRHGHERNKHHNRKKLGPHSKDNIEEKQKWPEVGEKFFSLHSTTTQSSTPAPAFPTKSTQWRVNGAEPSSKAIRSSCLRFPALFLPLLVALTETGVRWL